jgi:tetratricopeptide (TPR) repeat protein
MRPLMDARTPPREAAATTPDPAAARRRARRARRRPVRKALVRGFVLVALAGLTAWNWTRSDFLEEAVAAEARGDDPAALRAALDHLDRRPWSRVARRVAARCLSRLDFAERAEPYYRSAPPLSAEDRLTRAYGLTRANLRDRAVAAYREILKDDPGNVTALRLLAGVLLSERDWPGVIEVSRRLIDGPPGPVTVLAPVTAEGHWRLRPSTVPSPAEVGYALKGSAHREQGEAEASAEALERALALDPGLSSMPLPPPTFYTYLAEGLIRSGRSAEVVRLVDPAADGLNDPAVFDLLGHAHFQQGAFDAAERCWRRAVALDPKRVGAWRSLGRLELQRDRPGEAVRLLSRAEALQPGSYETAYALSLAYRRLGPGSAAQAQHYREEADRLRRLLPPPTGGMGAAPAPGRPPS